MTSTFSLRAKCGVEVYDDDQKEALRQTLDEVRACGVELQGPGYHDDD